MLFAQTAGITGTVTDSKDGSPLPGVTVRIKGGGATVTRTDGTFSINVPKDEVTLEFSFIGYFNKLLKATKGKSLSVSLEFDPKALSEVVITGVGVATSKKKLGISVETITSDKLPSPPNASISQALVGKIAGAQISSIDGTPGSKVNILLRGINSLRGGTSPMVLIDGIEVRATDLGSLDLNNVERIEVVEGAASSTIYGAQGANGVIQIFTKRGKQGQLNIDISSTAGTSTMVVVSSRPLCPPASKPSATTASQPAASAFWAKRLLLTTCTTVMPLSFKMLVQVLGLPAEVKTMGTFSSRMICMCFSISGYSNGTLTPKG